MTVEEVDLKRRHFLVKTTATMGAVGVAAASLPFAMSMLPTADVEAAGAPIKVNIAGLVPGDQLTVLWRGKPIWIVRRTEAMLKKLLEEQGRLRDPGSRVKQQPDYTKNQYRSIKPEIMVLVGICTHLGCSPTYRPDVGSLTANWPGGFFCSCHGSKFDLAGRVYRGMPAPINLEVPPYTFYAMT